MQLLLRNILVSILHWLARRRLARIRPQVIAITGSVGKTSTKEAISLLLRERFSVLASKGSYNTEFGLPLAILQEESGEKSVQKWIGILWRGLFSAQRYFEKFVAEFGADARGDIAKLVRLAQPSVGIITEITEVHLAERQFSSREDIFEEKATLVRSLPAHGWAILNGDCDLLRGLAGTLQARTLFYGTREDADLRAEAIESGFFGIRCIVQYKNHREHLSSSILGEHHLGILLAACATGLVDGLSLKTCVQTLKSFQLPKGRFSVLEGKSGSTILDSSYNASPTAVLQALKTLRNFPAQRRIAALGTMNELGARTEELHRKVAQEIPEAADVLVTVGEPAKLFGTAMQGEKHFVFQNSREAGKFLQSFLREGDVVLVKGSQNNVRMEWLTEAIMKYPKRASELLARQGNEWKLNQ